MLLHLIEGDRDKSQRDLWNHIEPAGQQNLWNHLEPMNTVKPKHTRTGPYTLKLVYNAPELVGKKGRPPAISIGMLRFTYYWLDMRQGRIQPNGPT